jgi:hypothetical protein
MSDNLAKIHQVLAKEVRLSTDGRSNRGNEVKLCNGDTPDAALYLTVTHLEKVLDEAQLQALAKDGLLLEGGTPARVAMGAKRPFAIGIAWGKLTAQMARQQADALAAKKAQEAKPVKPAKPAETDAEPLAHSAKVSGAKVTLLENRLRNMEKELKDARDASAVDVALVNLLDMIGQQYQRGKVKAPPAPTRRQRNADSHEGVAAVVLSDWHYGERVEKDAVNGLNEYNLAIADRRATRIFDATLKMLNPTPGKYDALMVPMLGDMLSGIIHEELVATNDGPIIDCILSLVAKLETGLVEFAQHFPLVQVVATYGNHGRMDRRKTHKAQSSLNYETLVYRMLEKQLKTRLGEQCNVQFKIATASDVTARVYDKLYLFTHGDQFDSNPGTAFERARAGDAAKRKRAHDAKQPVHDFLVCGHYHQYAASGNIIMNGSMIGYNEFAYHSNLSIERPQQALFVQHPKYGITRHSAVFAEEPAVSAKERPAPVSLELTY